MRVRVLDFGIARFFSPEATATHLTSPGLAPLTPAYAAPEQFRVDVEASPASDVFSLGRVGFELFTGRRPYAGIDWSHTDPHAPPPVPSVRSLDPSVPAHLAATIERALAYQSEDRFSDAEEFAAALIARGRETLGSHTPVPVQSPDALYTRRSSLGSPSETEAPTGAIPLEPVVSDNQDTARRGREAVRTALAERGIANVEEERRGNRHRLRVRSPDGSRSVCLLVKTRRSGTWQTSEREGDPDPIPPPTPTFWVFVDLAGGAPEFYVVPDEWMRKDIYENHQAYLARHGGSRAESPDSTHHAIALNRIRQWKDGWEGFRFSAPAVSPTHPAKPNAPLWLEPGPGNQDRLPTQRERTSQMGELRGKVLCIAPEVRRAGNPRRPFTHGWLAFEILRRAEGGVLSFEEYCERLFNPSPEIQEFARRIPGVPNAYQDLKHIRHDIRLGRVSVEL
jgi:hypothetical protein